MNTYYVYIMSSGKNGTLYIGVTNDIRRRIQEHKEEKANSFTGRYHVNRLVYYETTDSIEAAITREKQLKKWNRDWKLELIEKSNSNWADVSEEFLD